MAQSTNWAASWTTAIQAAYVAPTTPQGPAVPAYDPQPDLSFALPNATASGATDQTFRLIVKPDLWGDTVRIRLSNTFGTQTVTFGAVSIALQNYQANIVAGTSTRVTFKGGASSVRVPAGKEVFSDPVSLAFVDQLGVAGMAGRNLAVSVAVTGASGPASYHADAFVTSYISPPNSGDQTQAADDTAYPYSTTSVFFLSELDVQAPPGTAVIVAFGDSITDGTFSTLNGYDRWSNVMSRKLHEVLGNHVSVVNEAIAGNAVAGTLAGESAVERLNRDVINLSGVSGVVWLEGINDLGGLQSTPAPVIAGYQDVIRRLHAHNVAVIGATVTSSYPPNGQVPANSPLAAAAGPAFAASYGSAQTNGYRQQLNTFILTKGHYDATADFAAATTDPATGSLYPAFVPNSEGSAGDYLHPNRAGYQVMGEVAAEAVLSLFSNH
ncbi:MAG: lysophospholipase [Acidisphaera sp.]|nr:lysophospholipase [Acidisphaera sp.]